jgi:hypothetical protein
MLIAATTAAAVGDDEACALLDEIADQFAGIGISHDGAGGHKEHELGTVPAVLLVRRAVSAAFRPVLLLVSEGAEPVNAVVGDEHDIAAAATIASVRAAAWDELFAVEADEAVPTIPRRRLDGYSVNHCCAISREV